MPAGTSPRSSPAESLLDAAASFYPRRCLNCGYSLAADHKFCPQCGQGVGDSRITLGALLRDMWQEVVQIDSKLARTLVPLLFRPGFLTREYIVGKRVRYLSPFKMYLVAAAVFFGLASWWSAAEVGRVEASAEETEAPAAGGETKPPAPPAAHTAVRDRIRQAAPPHGARPAAADGDEDEESPAAGEAQTPSPPAPPERPGKLRYSLFGDELDWGRLPTSVAAYRKAQAALAPAAQDSPDKRWFFEHLIVLKRKSQTSKAELVAGVMGYFPYMMFFMLPVFAFLLKLLYWRSRRLYVEHFIFALHFHTVFFLVSALSLVMGLGRIHSALAGVVNTGSFTLGLWLGLTLYGILAARSVYRQGVVKTLIKGWLLLWSYVTALSFAIFLTVFIALAILSSPT
ncbi:MAG TPA: DUF3667 domain-containing protein [Polyangia bacterium]|nr:DUF3667 domain-containing protein [Polyangia bacterium]